MPKIKIEQRFFSKINMASKGECWEWLAAKDKDGYGYFYFDSNKGGKAHRFSWIYHNKKNIPKDKYILHKCNNPSCVNPNHLYLGTPMENMRDREKSGNFDSIRGEKNKFAKLTADIVLKIRKFVYDGVSRRKVASMFNTTEQNIYLIIKRKNWKHV